MKNYIFLFYKIIYLFFILYCISTLITINTILNSTFISLIVTVTISLENVTYPAIFRLFITCLRHVKAVCVSNTIFLACLPLGFNVGLIHLLSIIEYSHITNIMYFIENLVINEWCIYCFTALMFLYVSYTLGLRKVTILLLFSAIVKTFLYIINFTFSFWDLSEVISNLVILLIVSLILYGFYKSTDRVPYVINLLKKIFIIYTFWFVISSVLFSWTFNTIVASMGLAFIGNYVYIGLEDTDLSPLDTMKETIYGLFKNSLIGTGGPGGGGGWPNIDIFALVNLNTDSAIELDKNQEPDRDLHPFNQCVNSMMLDHTSVIEPVGTDYSDLHNFISSDTIKNLSISCNLNNASLIKTGPVEEAVIDYHASEFVIAFPGYYGDTPIDVLHNCKNSSIALTWEFNILTKAKLYADNKNLGSEYENSYNFWLNRQISGGWPSYEENLLFLMAKGWYVADYTNEITFYKELCNDLIYVELKLALYKSFFDYLIDNNIKLRYLSHSDFIKITSLVEKHNSKIYADAYKCFYKLNELRTSESSTKEQIDIYRYCYEYPLKLQFEASKHKFFNKGLGLADNFARKKLDFTEIGKIFVNRK